MLFKINKGARHAHVKCTSLLVFACAMHALEGNQILLLFYDSAFIL